MRCYSTIIVSNYLKDWPQRGRDGVGVGGKELVHLVLGSNFSSNTRQANGFGRPRRSSLSLSLFILLFKKSAVQTFNEFNESSLGIHNKLIPGTFMEKATLWKTSVQPMECSKIFSSLRGQEKNLSVSYDTFDVQRCNNWHGECYAEQHIINDSHVNGSYQLVSGPSSKYWHWPSKHKIIQPKVSEEINCSIWSFLFL